jgi:exopolyphosphatase/guanosine-5'-triphosphate,3'-diphosphate pyrophosphatase
MAISVSEGRRRAPTPAQDVLAAVDLGSNSFHMVVARFDHGQLTVIDRLREMVRIASGVDARNRLTEASQARALATLRRFGERLRDMQAGRVRVVGTNTLRKARATGRFLQRAAKALGHPVEIISGIEEARLIYLGASHNLPRVDGPQLVVDIGGGSTEIIAGRGIEPSTMESLALGCVSLSERCFPGGRLSAKNFDNARLQVRLELEPVRSQFRKVEPAQVAGTSGSIRAAHAVLSALNRAPHGVTVEGLEHLIDEMVAAGGVADLSLPELSDDRAEVFPGGVAILVEVMRALAIARMTVTDGALREGILYDMIGRLTDEDARVRTVRAMVGRYHVDLAQAERVEATALNLYSQVRDDWELVDDQRLLLAWAARLHELGLDIAHAHFHWHGAYVLQNADMPGFPREEQQVLACLVRAHRRKLERSAFNGLPGPWQRPALRLAVLLRLAALVHRSRTGGANPELRLRVQGRTLRLQVPATWLESNPLTLADLERECHFLAEADYKLVIQRRAAQ